MRNVEIYKDSFWKIMTFSFTQIEKFGTGSLVTRVTNDVTQVQNMVSQFVRGMIRTTLLTFGSIFCMFRLNARFGLTALCAFPFLAGTLAFCLWKANPLFAKLQMELDQINDSMQKDISRGLASWKRIRELLDEPSDLSEGSMIRQMPQGYDTRLCGGGNNISQGQR